MKMIIDGKLSDSVSGQVFNNINPYNGEIICTVPSGCTDDYERAAVIAKNAQPFWADVSFYKRAEIIKKFISLVKDNIDEIAAVVCHEGGKLISECKGELDCLCVIFSLIKKIKCPKTVLPATK